MTHLGDGVRQPVAVDVEQVDDRPQLDRVAEAPPADPLLSDRGIPFETLDLAIEIAFVRRCLRASGQSLPPIRSLTYFRAVALNLTPEEKNPAYADYITTLYDRLRADQLQQTDSSTAADRAS